jgi:hypothetical protein
VPRHLPQRMPAKRKASPRPTRANPKGKEVLSDKAPSQTKTRKTVAVVSPSKSASITKVHQSVEEEPTSRAKQAKNAIGAKVKKVAGKAKQIKAVMNVKTGKYKTHKTHKEIKTYLEEMTDMGVAENLKSFMFDSQEHLQQVSAAYKNNDDPPTHTPIFTSTASRPLAASVPVSPNPHSSPLSQATSTKYARFKKTPAVENLGVLAVKLEEKLSSINGTSLKLSLFPQATCVNDQDQYQVFAIDLVENKTDNTVWTHKPDAWKQVFQVDEDLTSEDGDQRIDPFFYSLEKACPRSVAKGPNVKKQLVTKNGKTVDFQNLWGMIKCTPDTEATLKDELVKFSILASDQSVQEAYHVAVKNMGANYPALLEQVMAPEASKPRQGEYWTKLSKSCTSDIKIVHHASMDEVFQDDVISDVVSFLWNAGGQSTSMWSDDMTMFAYGHKSTSSTKNI